MRSQCSGMRNGLALQRLKFQIVDAAFPENGITVLTGTAHVWRDRCQSFSDGFFAEMGHVVHGYARAPLGF